MEHILYMMRQAFCMLGPLQDPSDSKGEERTTGCYSYWTQSRRESSDSRVNSTATQKPQKASYWGLGPVGH